jgi:ATP-dependent 26S proteasome regulatory subunit
VLLYGKPGTGKTSYIRYLSTQVSKRMIFLSPEVSQYISSPEFITFLSSYTNSILIIEDAENVIKTRKAGGSSAISNLLNLTDGLLADCLNIQIICTFNTDVSQIDSALLRKGRLIAMYEFKELNKKKAKELALSLNKPVIIENDITLAELYNTEETGAQLVNFSKIGF